MQICFTFYTTPSEVIFSHLAHALFLRWHLVMCHLITDIRSDILIFFEYFGKITSQKRQRLIAFIFVNMIQHPGILKNNIDHLSKRGPPLFFLQDTNLVTENVLVHSIEKKHVLVVTGELIWLLFCNILFFNYVQTMNKSLRFRKFRRSYTYNSLFSFKPTTVKCGLLFWLDAHC